MGYTNIKIYNGGIKDWQKSGLQLDSITPLPDVAVTFISADQLRQKIDATAQNQCKESHGEPSITLLDFRNDLFLPSEKPPVSIATVCRTIQLQLDHLLKPEVRAMIPKNGMLVTITETGNRDNFVIRYLSKYGYDNISGLQFGMRSWLKQGYATH
jgi:rhodanese-related sulfurtransferase